MEKMLTLFQRALRKLRRETIRRTLWLRSPLRISLIGYGGIGPDHGDAYEATGRAAVVGISDLLPANLARGLDRHPSARGFMDSVRMLEELRPDAVSICTWPQSHADAVEVAVAAGVRGILCEKPLALSLSDIERMRAACAERNVKIAGGHQYRFHPYYTKAAELIRQGRLGRIIRVKGHIKSTLANNGPHLFDTVRFLLGDPCAEQVVCKCTRQRGDFNRGVPAEDSAEGKISFPNGIEFEFLLGDLAPSFFFIRIEGENGYLEITPNYLAVDGQNTRSISSASSICRTKQFAEFLQWVKGKRPVYSGEFEQGSQAVELMLACYESAHLGKPIVLPLGNTGSPIVDCYPGSISDVTPNISLPRFSDTPARLALNGGARSASHRFGASPTMGVAEMVRLSRVIISKNLSSTDGREVPALEREFARFYGSPRAVASTSGTAAIHVAVAALGLNPGDEIITTPMTDMGTVIPILACNCIPIFADIDPATGNLTAESIASKITPRTKAVILVHLFGVPADLDSIVDVLRRHGIPLIEDCSQAHGASYRGRKVGTFGAFGCFSLQQSKQITCGDGGITLVNDEGFAERAALFVDKGWDRKRGLRAHLFLGMNYRMTELQGAVALAQLRRLPALLQARRKSAEHLTNQIEKIRGILPPKRGSALDPSWWMYAFRIDEKLLGISTDAFAAALLVEGVRVRRQYLPVPIFEYDVLKHQRTYGDSGFPLSAYNYTPPDVEDFPGLRGFDERLLLIGWSHHARTRHAEEIASAIRKVTNAIPPSTVNVEARASRVQPILAS